LKNNAAGNEAMPSSTSNVFCRYDKLLELSPATLYPGALIAGEKGLLRVV